MDPDLNRLCTIPGNHDLSVAEVAEIMQVDPVTIRRMVRKGRLEAKLHIGRGEGKETRMRISRLSVVFYLVKASSGDRTAILTSISLLCPEYLRVAQCFSQNLRGGVFSGVAMNADAASAPAVLAAVAELEEKQQQQQQEEEEEEVKDKAKSKTNTKVAARRAPAKKARAVKPLKKRPETRKRPKRRVSTEKVARTRAGKGKGKVLRPNLKKSTSQRKVVRRKR